MDGDLRHASANGHSQEGIQMANVAVDAAITDKTDEMEYSASRSHRIAGRVEGIALGKDAIRDGAIDASQPLVDNKASAEVDMANFGVAHLAVGKADGFTRTGKRRVRIGCQQA